MSISKRGKGRYLVRIYMGRDPVTGKDIRPGKTIRGTRKQAEKFEREWMLAYERGQLVEDTTLTLNQHVKEWLETVLPSEVEPRTVETYAYDLKRFVLNTIGRLPISRIRPYDIQSLFVQLVDGGTGPTSVKRLRAALSKTFGTAVDWQRVTANPVLGTKVPGLQNRNRRPPKPMTAAESLLFLDAAGLTPWLALFELALSSGMRPAELLGLGWKSVDWEGSRVRVEQAAKYLRKKTYLGPPKTPQSRRSIPVGPKVLDSLRAHRHAQNTARLQRGEKWNSEHDLVFPNQSGGIWDENNFKKEAFDVVQEAAGLEGFVPYDLRHTCATLLMEKGEHPRVVAERLGHSSTTLTMDVYSHVRPTMQEAASERLDQLLFQTS